MTLRHTGTFAAVIALLGLCLMVLFLAGGEFSSEPGDHPVWMRTVAGTLPGHILWVILAFLCLPALLLAGILPVESEWGCYLTSCAFQVLLYFAVSFCFAHWFAARKRAQKGPKAD